MWLQTAGKTCHCPLKSNRLVGDSGTSSPTSPWAAWTGRQQKWVGGKTLKVKGMLKKSKLKLCRVPVSPHQADYLLANAVEPLNTAAAEHESNGRCTME